MDITTICDAADELTAVEVLELGLAGDELADEDTIGMTVRGISAALTIAGSPSITTSSDAAESNQSQLMERALIRVADDS